MGRLWNGRVLVGVVGVVGLLFGDGNLAEVNAALTTNRWVVNDGKWEIGTNWDHGVPTLSDAINVINNSGTVGSTAHTTTIDAATVASNILNNCMVISNLTLSGAILGPQTLLLTNASVVSPLKIGNTLSIGNHTSVIVSNAALQLGGTNSGTISDNGALTMFGGSISATNPGSSFAIGDSITGRMTVLGGTCRAVDVLVGSLAGSQGTLTMAGGTNVLSGSLAVGRFLNATGAVWMTGGQLTVTNDTTLIGYLGVGQMTVSNGTWRALQVWVGDLAGSQGTLTVAGGTNTVATDLTLSANDVGVTGTLWITGGQLAVTNGTTTIGHSGAAQITVSNGTWLARDVFVGLFGSENRTLTIAGGTVTLSGDITEQNNAAIWLTGGQLTITGATQLAEQGIGQMTVSNGVWRAGEVDIAYGGNGTLTLAGGATSLSGILRMGRLDFSTATLWLTGGELTITNDETIIGDVGVGQMSVSNGTWQAQIVYAGYNPGSQGTLTIAGGTNTLFALDIGLESGATGAVWVTGGQVTGLFNTVVGETGVGQMTVSNGTWSGQTTYVAYAAGSQGTLTVAGGTSLVGSHLIIGNRGCSSTGIVSVTGGELRVTNDAANAVLDLRGGTLTQSGGVLDIDRLVITNACGRFIHAGGTLTVGNTTLDPALDADGDGLPNGYEQTNGLDPLSPFGKDGADGDLDGDGMSNLAELLAGTKPNDANSALRIQSVIQQAGDVRIRWTTAGGHTNALQAADGAADGSYTNDFTDLAWFIIGGSGDKTNTYIDPDVVAMNLARYYRVRVVP